MKNGSVACLLLLAACSAGPQLSQPNQPLPPSKTSSSLTPRAPDADDVVFARLIKQDGQWRLKAIGSQRQPVDLLKGEERLYIQTGTGIIMPDYDHHARREGGQGLFDCGQHLKFNKLTTYNPCTSVFAGNIKFGEGWFGWLRQLDVGEIHKAVQQTDLLKQAGQAMKLITQERERCHDLRQQAEALVDKQKVALRVIDETGMYKDGHQHVRYGLKVKPEVAREGCEQELSRVKMNYDIGIEQQYNLVLEMRGKSGWSRPADNKLILQRSLAEAETKLIPTLYITGRKVEHYNLFQTWSNRDVELHWRTLDINETDLRQQFDIKNRADVPIEILQVTFHINGHTIHRRNRFQIDPRASLTGLEHASRYFMLEEESRRHVEAIQVINSQDEQAEFGISVRYTINGVKKTLRLSNKLKLTSIL